MSTNSNVAYKDVDGKYHVIYGHWDGGLWKGGVGDTLINYYNTLDKVKELLSIGDFSSLGDTIESTKFYSIDLHDYGPHTEKTIIGDDEILDYINDIDYFYLFENDEWKVFENADENSIAFDDNNNVIGYRLLKDIIAF